MNRNELIEENINLVHFIINRYYPSYFRDEDIIQTGMYALCRAAVTYDDTKSKFTTYAGRSICNEINDELSKRKKHYTTYSLDYPVFDADGNEDSFGDFQVGDEDVDWVDTDKFLSKLTPKEIEIYKLRESGFSAMDIAQKFGCSRESIYQKLRKMRAIWRETNGDSD